MEALIRKILEFLGEQGIIISADQSNWYVFWFGWGGWGDSKLQLAGVGKLNGWVLELTFAGQIINFKFLLVYLFFY